MNEAGHSQTKTKYYNALIWFLLVPLGVGIGFAVQTPSRLLLLLLAPMSVIVLSRPSIGLALFLGAAAYKTSPIFQPLSDQIDFTLFFAALVLVSVIRVIWRKQNSFLADAPKAFLLLLGFNIFLIAALLYTPDLAGGLDKVARFSSLTMLATLAPFFILRKERDWRLFLFGLLFIGLFSAAAGLINITNEQATIAQAISPAHIRLGRFAGLASLIAAALIVFGVSNRERAIGGLAFAIALPVVFLSSARGPFLSLIIALPMMLLFFSANRSSRRRALLLSIALPIASWALIAFNLVPSIFKERLTSIWSAAISGTGDASATNRLELFDRGLSAIRSSPLFGIGTGGFPSVAWDLPSNYYPHNIFLEIGAELGLPALTLFIGLLVVAVLTLRQAASARKARNDLFVISAITSLFVYWLINALFTGDLNSNRFLWSTMGLAFAIGTLGLSADKKRPAKQVCIITSVHPPFDTRIFHREAKTLKNAGYNVTLIAPHDSHETVDGINLIPIPKSKNRLARIFRSLGLWRLAYKVEADIYHFHDPELLPAMVILRLLKRKPVIYDVHEDYAAVAMDRHWLPLSVRRFVGFCFYVVETICIRFFQGIIYTTVPIGNRYRSFKNHLVRLDNYPAKATFHGKSDSPAKTTVVHVGVLAETRGILQLIQAFALLHAEYPKASLVLIGPCRPSKFADKMSSFINELKLDREIKVKPAIPYQEVKEALSQGQIGVISLLPYPNHLVALPNKLFQHMAIGSPIVASNFPLMKEIIDEVDCGLLIDPTRPEEIAKAIKYLLDHPEEARTMGARGHKAFLQKYNWETTSISLTNLYDDLLNGSQISRRPIPVKR